MADADFGNIESLAELDAQLLLLESFPIQLVSRQDETQVDTQDEPVSQSADQPVDTQDETETPADQPVETQDEQRPGTPPPPVEPDASLDVYDPNQQYHDGYFMPYYDEYSYIAPPQHPNIQMGQLLLANQLHNRRLCNLEYSVGKLQKIVERLQLTTTRLHSMIETGQNRLDRLQRSHDQLGHLVANMNRRLSQMVALWQQQNLGQTRLNLAGFTNTNV